MGIERRLKAVESKLDAITTPTPRVVERAPEPSVEQWAAGECSPVVLVAGVGAVSPSDRVRVNGQTISGADFIERVK